MLLYSSEGLVDFYNHYLGAFYIYGSIFFFLVTHLVVLHEDPIDRLDLIASNIGHSGTRSPVHQYQSRDPVVIVHGATLFTTLEWCVQILRP